MFLDRLIEGLRKRFFPSVPLEELDDTEWEALCRDLDGLAWLEPDQKADLRRLAAGFLAQKQFVGQGSCKDALEGQRGKFIRWTLAVYACLPVLRLGLEAYRGWKSIILVPESRRLKQLRHEGNGMVTEYMEDSAGEVLYWGPVIIALDEMWQAGRGYNVVIHEMAHKLDSGNGELDACPDLPEALRQPWLKAWQEAWDDFARQLARPARRRPLPLDEYAGTAPEEFFAVVMEEFFSRPHHLLRVYPGLYQLVAIWLGLDPARGIRKTGGLPPEGHDPAQRV